MKKITLGMMLLPVVAFGLNEKFLEDWGNKSEVSELLKRIVYVGGWAEGTDIKPHGFTYYDEIQFKMDELSTYKIASNKFAFYLEFSHRDIEYLHIKYYKLYVQIKDGDSKCLASAIKVVSDEEPKILFRKNGNIGVTGSAWNANILTGLTQEPYYFQILNKSIEIMGTDKENPSRMKREWSYTV